MEQYKDLRIIVPISLDLDWLGKEAIIEEILERYENYGIKAFCLAAPCGGWRSVGYPSRERYVQFAELFKAVKEELSEYDIELGWWITLTVKNGGSFTRIVQDNGEEHPFACCPYDPEFIKRFSEDVATFAEIAKPSFIITEDDFSIRAAKGCYCKYHLSEFARRMGKYYSREDIIAKNNEGTPDAIAFVREWREVLKDSLVGMGRAVREELDKKSPEIPMGIMQPGYTYMEGDATYEVARAFAGERHTPFVRFFGTDYGYGDAKKIPSLVYSTLFEKQRIKGDFCFLHESDTYPHTRYYHSGKQMRALMSSVYSFGYDGSTFQTNQLLDDGGEETAYARMLARERNRFTVVSNLARECEIRGVEIHFDPFFNTFFGNIPESSENYRKTPGTVYPCWLHAVSRWSLPYSTREEPVAFWDEYSARGASDETIKKYLSKTLFLDAAAAGALCEKGFASYLGVEVGEPVLKKHERLEYDLGAREIICEKFIYLNKGKHMPSPHMFSVTGNGKAYELRVVDDNCEVISELYSYDKKLITPLMTRFENELGGKIIVFGVTVNNQNHSHSVLNYRRQRLIQHLVSGGSDEYVYAKNDPIIFIIQNEAKDEATSGFGAMLTLSNLGEDDIEALALHLPSRLRGRIYQKLEESGEWTHLDVTETDDGIIINQKLDGLGTMFVLIK